MLHFTSEGSAVNANVIVDGIEDPNVESVIITCNAGDDIFTAEATVRRIDFAHSTVEDLIRTVRKYKVVKLDVTLEEIDF